MRGGLSKSQSRVKNDALLRNSCLTGCLYSRSQFLFHLSEDIVVVRQRIHVLAVSPPVHQHHVTA
jgi:hypothetical protein